MELQQGKDNTKNLLKHILRHQSRKGQIKFLVVWDDIEELGPMWEDVDTILASDSREKLKLYIMQKGTKSKRAILNLDNKLIKLFSKHNKEQVVTNRKTTGHTQRWPLVKSGTVGGVTLNTINADETTKALRPKIPHIKTTPNKLEQHITAQQKHQRITNRTK